MVARAQVQASGPRRDGDRPPRDGERGGPRRRDGDRGGRGGPERSERSGGPGPSRGGRPQGGRTEGRGRPQAPAQSTEYRNALLATLDSAQLTIAEQLLRGGIPAVRQAIEEQNAQAKAEGRPAASEEAIMQIAEGLLPLTTLAAWKDRAHSAQVAGKETRLRDLRAVVAASRSVSLDEEGRAMSKALHETLDHRVKSLSDEWVKRITTALDENRVVDAFKLASRSPEHSTRLPAEVATRLAETAGATMTAESDPASGWRCSTPSSSPRCGGSSSPRASLPRPTSRSPPGTQRDRCLRSPRCWACASRHRRPRAGSCTTAPRRLSRPLA